MAVWMDLSDVVVNGRGDLADALAEAVRML